MIGMFLSVNFAHSLPDAMNAGQLTNAVFAVHPNTLEPKNCVAFSEKAYRRYETMISVPVSS